ncbi:MAG: hypothetical protein WC873_00935 [Candidatus Gracilibacteria bacterium]
MTDELSPANIDAIMERRTENDRRLNVIRKDRDDLTERLAKLDTEKRALLNKSSTDPIASSRMSEIDDEMLKIFEHLQRGDKEIEDLRESIHVLMAAIISSCSFAGHLAPIEPKPFADHPGH